MKVLVGDLLDMDAGKAAEFDCDKVCVRFVDNRGHRIVDFRQSDNGIAIDVNSMYPLMVLPKASNHVEIEVMVPVGQLAKLKRKRKRVKI